MRGLGFVALLALAACGGKGSSDTGGTSGGDDDDGSDVVIDCSSIPQFTLDGMSCEQLASSLETLTSQSTACNADTDCQPIHPGCQDWPEARCYYAANTCVTGSMVTDFNQHSQQVGCGLISGQTTSGCGCYDPPPMTCDHHVCRCVPETDCEY